jgi:hypothetical protein
MARKISFRTKVAECLDKGDASTFQSLFNNKLVESLDMKKIDLISGMIKEQDFESQIVSQLTATAQSYGGNDMIYNLGVMDIKFNDAGAIKDFTEQLDKIDGIDYYEIGEPVVDLENNTGGTDLEFQGNKAVYEVTVYLDLENVSLPSDIDTYIENLDQFDEAACGKKKKDKLQEVKDESDDEEDEESDDEEECKKESLQFSTIFDKVALKEFLVVKTAHWNQQMHKAVAKTDKVCPPGRTGADCKTVLSAQQKMALRKRMLAHLKKLSRARRSKMASHASATKAFIKQHNLMSKSAAKAKLGR